MNQPTEFSSSPGPPRPEKLTVDFFEEPDGIAVRTRRGVRAGRAAGPGCFLLLWLIAWTVGCVMLAAKLVQEPAVGTFVFAIPFWASWFAVAAFVVWLFFGTETLLIKTDKALFLRTALVQISSRAVPRGEIRMFRECRSQHTENDAYLWGIEMVTLGKPVRFAFRLAEQERMWIIHQLNSFLAATGTTLPAESQTTVSQESTVKPAADRSAMPAERLDRDHTLAEPPTDCKWNLGDEVDPLVIWRRGRLHLGALFGLLFVNAFWNGIVGVFVMVLCGGIIPVNNPAQGGAWWGMFFFLIPFEVIGLIMFLALVFVILEPLHFTTWRFDYDRIERQSRWPLFRRLKSWDIVQLSRLELRSPSSDTSKGRSMKQPISTGSFALAFINAENADVCSVDDLTEERPAGSPGSFSTSGLNGLRSDAIRRRRSLARAVAPRCPRACGASCQAGSLGD